MCEALDSTPGSEPKLEGSLENQSMPFLPEAQERTSPGDTQSEPVMVSFPGHEDTEIPLSALRPGPWFYPTPDSVCLLSQVVSVHA